MRTIGRYICSSFLAAFFACFLVITFVLSLGALFKITQLLARGLAWLPILQVFACGLCSAAGLAIPMAALVASLLVFGRLSADGEIVAMSAGGMSRRQIASGPLLLSLLLTAVCLHMHNEVMPKSHMFRRQSVALLGVVCATDLLDEGRFIDDFPGVSIYVGSKKDTNVGDVIVCDSRQEGLTRQIRARTGTIAASDDGRDLVLNLRSVSIDSFHRATAGSMTCDTFEIRIEDVLGKREVRKGKADMSFSELLAGMLHTELVFPNMAGRMIELQRAAITVEFHERIALSLACFAFVLVGIPLGITSRRKESWVGVGIGLFVMLCFYVFVLLADGFRNRPESHPHLIVWIPVLLCCLMGARLLRD